MQRVDGGTNNGDIAGPTTLTRWCRKRTSTALSENKLTSYSKLLINLGSTKYSRRSTERVRPAHNLYNISNEQLRPSMCSEGLRRHFSGSRRMGKWFSRQPFTPPAFALLSNVPASWKAERAHWGSSSWVTSTCVYIMSTRTSTSHQSGILDGSVHSHIVGLSVHNANGEGLDGPKHVPNGS